MTERNAEQVLRELIEKADNRYAFETLLSGRRDGSRAADEKRSKLVGKLVESLSEEDRELLKGLTSANIEKAWSEGFRRKRPEKVNLRVRGPVTLSKGEKK